MRLPVELVNSYDRLAQTGPVVPPVKREKPKTPAQDAPAESPTPPDAGKSDGWTGRDIGIIGRIQDWLARANRTFQSNVVKRLSIPPGGAPPDDATASEGNKERDAKARAAAAAQDEAARKAAAAKQDAEDQAEQDRRRQAEVERQKAIDDAMEQVRAKEAAAAKTAETPPKAAAPKSQDSAELADEMRKEREKLEAETKRIESEHAAAAAKRQEDQRARTEARLAERRRAEQEKAERDKAERERADRAASDQEKKLAEDRAARSRQAEEQRAADATDATDSSRNRRRTVVITTERITRPEPYVRQARGSPDAEIAERTVRAPARGPVVNRWFWRAKTTCSRAGRRIQPPGHYVVAPGDTLWLISRKHYRSGWLYSRIYWANRARIRNPNRIYPCERLFVPRRPR